MPLNLDIDYYPISKPTEGRNNYQGFHPGKTEILPKGWSGYGGRPTDSDILVEHDVEVVLRDGCKIYVDIYRPPNQDVKVPAILAYSPFGKKYNGLTFITHVPYNVGVIPADISGLEKFEAPDPGKWVARNFAIINVDARGAGNSQGKVPIMGTQEGEDGYDVVEAMAKKPWCNGKVGMAGNSHLAIVQWFVAQRKPPSLAAIAPWEGCADLYREQFARGGTFNLSNFGFIQKFIIQGTHGVEDFGAQYKKSKGLIDEYWADKRADLASIDIPAYITASDFGSIHTMGSLRGYMQLNTPNKWLRWCGYQEWHDLWSTPGTNEELMQFFDYFLKGEKNGWEKTPKVRMSVLQFGDKEAIQNIEVPDFPLPDTKYTPLYCAADGKLSLDAVGKEGSVTYQGDKDGSSATFQHTFTQKTRLLGIPKAHLFMSCDDHDDMSVTIELRKLDKTGKALRHLNIPFSRFPHKSMDDLPEGFNNGLIVFNGSSGMLRASHRAIDRSQMWHDQWPFHPHNKIELVKPGTIVELEIGIWSMGVDYEAGESIRMDVCGSNLTWPELKEPGADIEVTNKGEHRLHFGGQYASRVILPFV